MCLGESVLGYQMGQLTREEGKKQSHKKGITLDNAFPLLEEDTVQCHKGREVHSLITWAAFPSSGLPNPNAFS